MCLQKVWWLIGIISALFLCSLAFGVPNQYILEYDDEADDFVSVPHHSDFDAIDDGTSDTWTLEAWIYTRSHGRIFDKLYWSFYTRPDGALRFSNNAGGNATTSAGAVTWDTWAHVAVVKESGSNLKFYVNGSQVGSPIACPTLDLTTDTLIIGNGPYAVRGHNGFMDEFRISNIARDPGTYINATYYTTTAPLGADDNTIAYWNCDEGSGTTLNSQQGSGFSSHNGTFGDVHGAFDPAWQTWNYPAQTLPLPSELTSFYAENGDGVVILHWTTQSEIENAGFHIYRSLKQNQGFQRINGSIIPSQGSSPGPQVYTYEDQHVSNGVAYYYKISDEDINGHETMHNFLAVGIPGVDLGGMTVEQAILNGQLAQYRLEQNYPNPFNPSTNITFTVLDAGEVYLSVYNVRGEKVRTMIGGDVYEAGTYSVPVNMEGLASGIYYYELKGDRGFRTVRKMLFVR
jgi:hypothetical protein